MQRKVHFNNMSLLGDSALATNLFRVWITVWP